MSSKTTRWEALTTHFSSLEDPRIDRRREHDLLDILGLTIVAVICGADDWVGIETFGKARIDFLLQFLNLANGIPSHDTLGRLYKALCPKSLEKCFSSWIQAICDLAEGEVVAIDGKCLRGSHERQGGKAAIYMVNAWASQNGLCLGQVKVNEKSNEITAIPELLDLLDLSGCIVTIDAMGTQKHIAQKIIDKKADYLLSLKQNHGALYDEVQATFKHLSDTRFTQRDDTWDKGHGRIESRVCYAVDLLADDFDWILSEDLNQWPELSSITLVQSVRYLQDGRIEKQERYFLSSLKLSECSAADINQAVRAHWAVENQLHWTLDVAFREDHSRVRKGNADQNFAIIRRLALGLIKKDAKSKVGVQNRRMKAAWDQKYLMRVLQSKF